MSEQAQTQVTGTPDPTVTDDAANAALSAPVGEDDRSADVAPETDGGDEGKQERVDWKAMALSLKARAEERHELQRELAELRKAAAAQPPTYQQQSQAQQQLAVLAQSIQEAQYDAANGDKRAALLVATLQQTYALQNQLVQQQQLQGIPSDDRTETMTKFQTGRFADMEAAYDAVLADRYRKSLSTLAQQQKEVQQAQARQQRGVVGNGRPIPVTSRELDGQSRDSFDSPSAYQAEHARIFNEHGPDAARAFAQRQMRGEIRIKGA